MEIKFSDLMLITAVAAVEASKKCGKPVHLHELYQHDEAVKKVAQAGANIRMAIEELIGSKITVIDDSKPLTTTN